MTKTISELTAHMRLSDIGASRRYTMCTTTGQRFEILSVSPEQIALLQEIERIAVEAATPEQRAAYEDERARWSLVAGGVH